MPPMGVKLLDTAVRVGDRENWGGYVASLWWLVVWVKVGCQRW